MKRFLSLLLVVGLMSPLFSGCSGEDGAAGPAGPAGSPQPIKVLFAGADAGGEAGLKSSVAGAFACGGFPLGTVINYLSMSSSTPELTFLRAYDVVVAYSNGTFDDGEAVGDVLADYVDAGGKLVILQYALTTTWAINGRIMTAGYSPLRPAAIASISGNRSISYNSLTFPLHPIFNGTDVTNLVFFANSNTSNPALDATATLIALDDKGANAIAINATGTVMALQVSGAPVAWSQTSYPYSGILVANACLFLADAF